MDDLKVPQTVDDCQWCEESSNYQVSILFPIHPTIEPIDSIYRIVQMHNMMM